MNANDLRLGLVGPLPPPNGGMAMQTLQLEAMLRETGLQVELLQTNAPYRPAFIGRLRGVRALFRLLPYLWHVWQLAGRCHVIHLMANSGWSWQLFAAPVVWMGWMRRTPVVVNYRGGEAGEYLNRSARWVGPTLRRATKLIVPSGFLQRVFGEHGFEAKIVPNIIDLDLFSVSAGSRGQDDSFTVVVTRNLEAIYGLDIALRAIALVLAQYPQVRLKVAGSGPLEDALRQQVRELGINEQVSFLGRLDRAGIVALYAEADAMLNPTRVDNMPNSVLEALACGLPVVSTNVGGVPYIVEHGRTALLVEPDDPEAMSQAIAELIENSDLYLHLKQQGIREVSQYSREQVQPRWIELYRDLAGVA